MALSPPPGSDVKCFTWPKTARGAVGRVCRRNPDKTRIFIAGDTTANAGPEIKHPEFGGLWACLESEIIAKLGDPGDWSVNERGQPEALDISRGPFVVRILVHQIAPEAPYGYRWQVVDVLAFDKSAEAGATGTDK